MRIGYAFWGFLGDVKVDRWGTNLSTPDGNATYSWALIYELLTQGHEVWRMMPDRDVYGHARFGDGIFQSFAKDGRALAYHGMKSVFNAVNHSLIELPELDILLLEWRMPVPGRNCVRDESGAIVLEHSDIADPDLKIQKMLLEHYSGKNTKIIIWDLDHKLTAEDEEKWKPWKIFETSYQPREQYMKRVSVEFPTKIEMMRETGFKNLKRDKPDRLMTYIGSRYERDDVITEWIKPLSDKHPNQVYFYGNWWKTVAECRKLWPNVVYMDRVTTSQFASLYGRSVACPLLAKRSYLETGFITPRPVEALAFGTLPVGLRSHLNIHRYVPFSRIADSGEDMVELVEELSTMPYLERLRCFHENMDLLSRSDARYFVNDIFGEPIFCP